MNGPIMATAPSRTDSLVRAAAWAMGADPWPASLEYRPRRTPHMITVIRPPQPALREKASVNMVAKLGRMASGRDRKMNMALPTYSSAIPGTRRLATRAIRLIPPIITSPTRTAMIIPVSQVGQP